MSSTAEIELAQQLARVMNLADDAAPPRVLSQGTSTRGRRAVARIGDHHCHVRLVGRGPAARNAFGLEALAYEMLPQLDAEVAPRALAVDRDEGVIITEDVSAQIGEGARLQELLVECGPGIADAIDALGTVMAELSKPAPKLVNAWRKRAEELQMEPQPALRECELWHAGIPRLASLCADLGVAVDASLEEEARALFPAWTGTRLCTGFTHGDPAPANNFIGTDGARLLDFEFMMPRHPLFDLAQWSVRCPLPLDWFVRMLAQFERTHCGERSYYHSLDEMLGELERVRAVSALYLLLWLPGPMLIDRDQSWVGAWTTRGAAIHAAEALHAAASSQPDLSGLSALGFKLARAMRNRWPGAVSEIDFQRFADYVPDA